MGGVVFNFWGGLFFDRCDNYVGTTIARTLEHQKWKAPVTGYQPILHIALC
jgi:hypothetical protein